MSLFVLTLQAVRLTLEAVDVERAAVEASGESCEAERDRERVQNLQSDELGTKRRGESGVEKRA